jgi:hypothetical protein
MEHLKNEFGKHIKYVCIASESEVGTNARTVYIQITLDKQINKKTDFLKEVAGLNEFYTG